MCILLRQELQNFKSFWRRKIDVFSKCLVSFVKTKVDTICNAV